MQSVFIMSMDEKEEESKSERRLFSHDRTQSNKKSLAVVGKRVSLAVAKITHWRISNPKLFNSDFFVAFASLNFYANIRKFRV